MYPNEDKYYNEWANDRESNALYPTWLRENHPEEAKRRAEASALPDINYSEFNKVRESDVKPTFPTFQDYQDFLIKTYGSSAAPVPVATAAPAPAPAPATTLAPVTLLSGQNTFPDLKIDPRYDAPAPAALAAPTSVLGMFPEVDAMQRALYQQKQNEAMQAQAMQYARLDPMQQAQYSLYLGGQQLGGAIGGALGAKDPQLQMIGLQQQILRELDPSDPAQNIRVAQKYAQVAPDLAMKIADNARSSLVKIAQANKERQAAIGVPLQVSNRINELKQKMRMLPPDSVEYQDAEEEITRLMKPEKPEPRPSVGTDREAFALTDFNKNYYDLTPDQREKVNVKADEKTAKDAAAKAPKIQVDLKDPTAVAKASLDVMNKWENFIKQDVEVANRFKALQSSISLAQGGNPSADGATIFNIGKIYDPSGAVQEGDKNTILGNPSIPQKIKGYAQRVFEGGSLTPEQRVDLLRIGNELIKGRQSQLNTYRKQYVNKNKALGGDESDILNPYEGLLKIDSGAAVQQIPTQRSGKSAKSWNDLN